MQTLSYYKEQLRNYKNEYASRYGISRIGIFGSVARGEQTNDSDLDIVVDLQNPSFTIMYNIHENLSKMFDCNVDVVRYRDSLRPLFKANIDREAIYV